MIHEDAVLEKHPQAKEFRPVKALLGNLFGWTFEVPADKNGHAKNYGWVTCDGEVSSDTLRHRDQAERNLRTYMRTRGPKPVAELGSDAAWNAK